MNLFSLTPVGILEEKARKLINNVFPSLLDKISYSVESHIPLEVEKMAKNNETPDGAYEETNKTVYLRNDSLIETAIHEIGHAVHYQLFAARDFELSNINKSKGAFLNHKEDFAEAFMDCIINVNNKSELTKRDNQIIKIIQH